MLELVVDILDGSPPCSKAIRIVVQGGRSTQKVLLKLKNYSMVKVENIEDLFEFLRVEEIKPKVIALENEMVL